MLGAAPIGIARTHDSLDSKLSGADGAPIPGALVVNVPEDVTVCSNAVSHRLNWYARVDGRKTLGNQIALLF
jgi:hypothetical protein